MKCLQYRTESNLLCCELGAHFLCWAWVHKPSLNPGLRAYTLWWVGEVSISRAKWAVKRHTTVRLRARAHLTWMSNLSASFICMSSTEPKSEIERELPQVMLRAEDSWKPCYTSLLSQFWEDTTTVMLIQTSPLVFEAFRFWMQHIQINKYINTPLIKSFGSVRFHFCLKKCIIIFSKEALNWVKKFFLIE